MAFRIVRTQVVNLETASISLSSGLPGKERLVCVLDFSRVSRPSKESESYDPYGNKGPSSIWSVRW